MPRYVGKKYDHESKAYEDAVTECDSASPVGIELAKRARHAGDIECADVDTAEACGVVLEPPKPFVDPAAAGAAAEPTPETEPSDPGPTARTTKGKRAQTTETEASTGADK
jgi:hypothetical protein